MTLLEVRAGSLPSAIEMILRYHRILRHRPAGTGRHHHGSLRAVVIRPIVAAYGAAEKQSGVFLTVDVTAQPHPKE